MNEEKRIRSSESERETSSDRIKCYLIKNSYNNYFLHILLKIISSLHGYALGPHSLDENEVSHSTSVDAQTTSAQCRAARGHLARYECRFNYIFCFFF